MAGGFLPNEITNGFVRHVGGQRQKAAPDDPQGAPFEIFTAMRVRVHRHAPQEGRSRRHFDEAIHAETHQRNAPREYARANGNEPFEAIPHNREIFQVLTSLGQCLPVCQCLAFPVGFCVDESKLIRRLDSVPSTTGTATTDLPIACTPSLAALRLRRERLLSELLRRAEGDQTLANRQCLPPAPTEEMLSTITRTVDAERQCCLFFRFQITSEPRGGPILSELLEPDPLWWTSSEKWRPQKRPQGWRPHHDSAKARQIFRGSVTVCWPAGFGEGIRCGHFARYFSEKSVPNGIRTRVLALKGPRPGPLDDGDLRGKPTDPITRSSTVYAGGA